MLPKKSLVSTVGLTLAVAGWVAFIPAAHAAPSSPVVVVSGLNNPRQLVLVTGDGGPELLIAEAGKGGPTQVGEGDDASFVGFTGSISSVYGPATTTNAKPKRVVTGLISAGGPDGSFAVGSDGVGARFSGGKIYTVMTYAPPDVTVPPAASAQLGHLLYSQHNGPAFPLQDVSAFEIANNPAGDNIDSNPYSVLARKDDILVADAAGNSIIRYGNQGYGPATLFAALPNYTTGQCATIPANPPDVAGCDFVPTSLAQDAAGNVYVGGLGSEVPGQARVVKLDPAGRVVKTWTGFTGVTGVAVGADGSLYVSQLFAPTSSPFPGVLTKISPNGTKTDIPVPFPAGVAVDASNNVYVSAFSTAPEGGLGAPGSSGQVWRVRF